MHCLIHFPRFKSFLFSLQSVLWLSQESKSKWLRNIIEVLEKCLSLCLLFNITFYSICSYLSIILTLFPTPNPHHQRFYIRFKNVNPQYDSYLSLEIRSIFSSSIKFNTMLIKILITMSSFYGQPSYISTHVHMPLLIKQAHLHTCINSI